MTATKLRAIERRQDTARLAAPQIFPLAGDGWVAQGVTAPLRGGPDSYLGRDRRGRWREVLIVPSRPQLTVARYRDWLYERNAS